MFKKIIKSKIFYFCISLIVLFAAFKIFKIDHSEKFWNVIAKALYFDEIYYLENYPEVKDSPLSPFDHYAQIGWKEGKNPNREFDSKFYYNFYLLRDSKYALNPLAHFSKRKFSFLRKYFLKKIYTKSDQVNAKVTLLESPKYYLSLVAVFQNEARFLREWIEFYRMMGVEHFYLYNHLSTDDYMSILEPYIKEGVVDIDHILEIPNNTAHWDRIQCKMYTELSTRVANVTEWLLVVDTDEFLFSLNDTDLQNVLKKYDNFAALSVNWKLFGASGLDRIPDNKLLIESLVYSAENVMSLAKTIVKPRYVESFTSQHYPNLQDGYAQVDYNFTYFKGAFVPNLNGHTLIINHYWSRDLEFFKKAKINRVHVKEMDQNKSNKEEKRVQNLIEMNKQNSVKYDDAILKFVPDLRARVFGDKAK